MGHYGKLNKQGCIRVLEDGLDFCKESINDIHAGIEANVEDAVSSILAEMHQLHKVLYSDGPSCNVPASKLVQFERDYKANMEQLKSIQEDNGFDLSLME